MCGRGAGSFSNSFDLFHDVPCWRTTVIHAAELLVHLAQLRELIIQFLILLQNLVAFLLAHARRELRLRKVGHVLID